MNNSVWAPMGFKCFAALILSVALLGCGGHGSANAPAAPYPIVSQFPMSDLKEWCANDLGLDLNNLSQSSQCVGAYWVELQARLTDHYHLYPGFWSVCFDSSNPCFSDYAAEYLAIVGSK